MWVRFCRKWSCFIVGLLFSNRDWRGGISDPSENETIETPGDEEKNEDSTDNSNENQEDDEIEADADVDYTVL